jgi:hypothetical protein
MTPAEWDEFELELLSTFRSPREGLDDAQRTVLQARFGLVPLSAARAAIHRLVQRGQVFVPVPGELYVALQHVAGGNAWRLRTWLEGGAPSDEQMLERFTGGRRRLELEAGS